MSTLKKKIVVGIMGPDETATLFETGNAYKMGNLIGLQDNWVLLTNGSNYGVMNGALKGAKDGNPNCTTMGMSSCRYDEADKISEYADIKIPAVMSEVNILTSDFIIFCCDKIRNSIVNFSELVIALKHKKPIIFLVTPDNTGAQTQYYKNVLSEFEIYRWYYSGIITDSPEEVIRLIQNWHNRQP